MLIASPATTALCASAVPLTVNPSRPADGSIFVANCAGIQLAATPIQPTTAVAAKDQQFGRAHAEQGTGGFVARSHESNRDPERGKPCDILHDHRSHGSGGCTECDANRISRVRRLTEHVTTPLTPTAHART